MSAISQQSGGSIKTSESSFVFRLYVAGEAPNSVLALRNLKAYCKKYYGEDYKIDVVDVLLSPERAWAEGVIVTPMTVKVSPLPSVQIIGNLSNMEQVLSILNAAE
jgi:circadian clock protein KaiB